MFASLTGYRTYIQAALIAGVMILASRGIIDSHTLEVLLGLLGWGTISSMRSAIENNKQ